MSSAARYAAAVTAGGGADYLIFGTVFATPSKPGQPAAVVGALAAGGSATKPGSAAASRKDSGSRFSSVAEAAYAASTAGSLMCFGSGS